MANSLRTGRAPTMRDVAERAGVSRQLVSLVMRNEPGPSEASRTAILAAAAALDFRPNTSARLLRQDRTRLIGVLFEAHNPFEARFVERFIEAAHSDGWRVQLAPITPNRDTETVVAELLEFRVEALACFNPDPTAPSLQRALSTIPVVWLGERSADERADAVHADDETNLMLLVEHLVLLGHRHIAYAGDEGGRVGPDRADAYRAAMHTHSLGEEIDVISGGFSEEDGAAAARTLLNRPQLPTAVIACSDQSAIGLLAVFARAGIDVPSAISVTGYDDSDIAGLSFYDLTVAVQDLDLTVQATLDSIRRRMVNPEAPGRDTPTTASLTVRGSTGPARAH